MQSNIIEWDRLFIMLARHKCLKVFPMLKSVYFPPSSLRRGQLPLSQHMIAEALCWNTTLSHDGGGLQQASLLWRSAPCLHEEKEVCVVFASKKPCPSLCLSLSLSLFADQSAAAADLPCSGERQQVGARALAKCFQSSESIWAEMCLQTRYSV